MLGRWRAASLRSKYGIDFALGFEPILGRIATLETTSFSA